MNIVDSFEIGKMDELGRMDTPVHRLDARAKAVVTFVFIGVVMSFPRHAIASLTPFLLYPVALVSLGRIPVRYLARKILIAAPFALVIGIFNPLLDREPVATLGPFVLTGGWLSFFSILLRFGLTVGAALALVACTGMPGLAEGLARLGVPRVFVVQLLFLHRYLFVLAEESGRLLRSVALRSGGARHPPLRVCGSLLGHLLLRSLDRSERVYRAMSARGFTGQVRTLRRATFRPADGVFAAVCLMFFAAVRRWNVAEWIGRLLTGSAS